MKAKRRSPDGQEPPRAAARGDGGDAAAAGEPRPKGRTGARRERLGKQTALAAQAAVAALNTRAVPRSAAAAPAVSKRRAPTKQPRGERSRTVREPGTLDAAKARLRSAEARVAKLEAEVKRLTGKLEAEREAGRQRADRARRRFESRLTQMVQELGMLRHHEARAAALERELARRSEKPSS